MSICYFLFVFVLLLFSLYSFFFFKQKTAYEMRISDWSSDVCSSDLRRPAYHFHDLRALDAKKLVIFGAQLREAFRSDVIGVRVAHDEPSLPVRVERSRDTSCAAFPDYARNEIGRASCRERVCQYV